MGDIADDCFDRAMDELADLDCDYVPYRTPRKHAYGPRVACKFCGANGLFWQRVRGGHHLYEKATLQKHICAPRDNTPEGFE